MKIVIVGSNGRLGAALLREYREKFDVIGFNHAQLDLEYPDQIRSKIDQLEFDLMINCAAFTNLDLCEAEPERAFQINAEAPKVLAQICGAKKAKLIHFSTDYVFEGEKREPYLETEVARPISVYAKSKLAGERNVLGTVGEAVGFPDASPARTTATPSPTNNPNLIVRVSWVFGPDRPSFVDLMIKRAREEEHVEAVADKFSAPTYSLDIAKVLPRFFPADFGRVGALRRPRTPQRGVPTIDAGRAGGILHFANAGECSWQEYAQFAIDCCRSLGVPLKARAVGALKLADMKNWVAHRPVYSVLNTEKFVSITGTTPRNWRDAVGEYVKNFYS
jgi:dTDP-4-dehydrorhamnose reductase